MYEHWGWDRLFWKFQLLHIVHLLLSFLGKCQQYDQYEHDEHNKDNQQSGGDSRCDHSCKMKEQNLIMTMIFAIIGERNMATVPRILASTEV